MRKIKVSIAERADSIFNEDVFPDIYEAKDNESNEEIISNCADYLFDNDMFDTFESAEEIENYYVWSLWDIDTNEKVIY